MSLTKGVGCHYNYKISLDIVALMEYIAKKIGANGEIDDYTPELDGEDVVFKFNDYIDVDIYSAPATRWEPAEWEMDAPDWVEFDKDTLNRLITKALREVPDDVVKASYHCDFDEYELDED